MSDTASKFPFKVGGDVSPDNQFYISRSADALLLEACLKGRFPYILASRQIGKSSLIRRAAAILTKENNYYTAVIDLNAVGTTHSADTWYLTFLKKLIEAFHLTNFLVKTNKDWDLETWWRNQGTTPTDRLLNFLRDCLLPYKSPVVIFIDEIDSTLQLDFTDDFFAAIRSIHNDKADQNSPYRPLTFVLSGVATPDELIRDHKRTPFNIGYPIGLNDFTREECAPFCEALEMVAPQRGKAYFEEIYIWIKGHPFFTQKFTEEVVKSLLDSKGHDITTSPPFKIPVIRGEPNLAYIQHSMLGDYRQARDLLLLYQRIFQNEAVNDDENNSLINRLKLIGLVISQQGKLIVRNQLYQHVFNAAWIETCLQEMARHGVPKRYTIIQTLSSTEHAVVYLAKEREHNGNFRQVALKVLHPTAEQTKAVKELITDLEKEARIVKQLNHPNIIEIYDTSQTETGTPEERAIFIAMAYIAGGTLGTYLEQNGPFNRAQAIRLMQQIGDALKVAHEKKFIHCDVKPNNILLDTTHKPPRPILTDFGEAQHLTDEQEEGGTTGTHRYMAPEQWRGEKSTPATDIYALAFTFFQMLTGHPPFEDHQAVTLKDKHLNAPFPSLNSVSPQLARFFDPVLTKATAKDTTERYQQITDFLAALNEADEVLEADLREGPAAQGVEAAQGYSEQNPEVALKLVEAILEDYVDYHPALLLKGDIQRQQNQSEAAWETYQKAYQLNPEPTSTTGLKYLAILEILLDKAITKPNRDYQLNIYRTFKHVLNQAETNGYDVGRWQAVWQEHVTTHFEKGYIACQQEIPVEIKQIEQIVRIEEETLDTLGATTKIKTLQQVFRNLQVKQLYYEGQTLIEQAKGKPYPTGIQDVNEVIEKKIKALAALEAYLNRDRLQIQLNRLNIDYHTSLAKQAYAKGEPEQIVPALQTIEIQLDILQQWRAEPEIRQLEVWFRHLEILQIKRGAQNAYKNANLSDLATTIQLLETHLTQLDDLKETHQSDFFNQTRQALVAWRDDLRIKNHYQQAKAIYQGGKPADLPKAIQGLADKLEALGPLQKSRLLSGIQTEEKALTKTNQVIDQLQTWLNTLRLRNYDQQIKKIKTDLATWTKTTPLPDETGFAHYEALRNLYQDSLAIQPDQSTYQNELDDLPNQEAKHYLRFATENKTRPGLALEYYQKLLLLEEQQPGVLTHINQNGKLIKAEIAELQKQAQYDESYQKIQGLIAKGKYSEALKLIRTYFIDHDIYNYKDVGFLFYGVAHALKKDGDYPPEWRHLIDAQSLVRGEISEAQQVLQTSLALLEQKTALTNQVQQVTALLKQLTANAAELKADVPPLEKDLRVLEEDLKKAIHTLETEVKPSSQVLTEYQQHLPTTSANNVPTKLPKLLEFLNQADRDLTPVNYPFETINSMLAQTNTTLTLLGRSVTLMDKGYHLLAEQQKKITESILKAKLDATLEERDTLQTDLKQAQKSHQAKITSLQQEITALTGQVNTAKASLVTLQKEKDEVVDQKNDLTKQLKDLKTTNTQQATELTSLTEQLETEQATITTLRQEKGQVIVDKDIVSKELKKAQEAHATHEQTLNQLQGELQTVRTRSNRIKQHVTIMGIVSLIVGLLVGSIGSHILFPTTIIPIPTTTTQTIEKVTFFVNEEDIETPSIPYLIEGDNRQITLEAYDQNQQKIPVDQIQCRWESLPPNDKLLANIEQNRCELTISTEIAGSHLLIVNMTLDNNLFVEKTLNINLP